MEPDDAPRIVPRTEPFRNCYFELHGRRTTHGLFSNLNCISHFKSLEDRTDPHQEGSRRFARSIFLPLFRLTDVSPSRALALPEHRCLCHARFALRNVRVV